MRKRATHWKPDKNNVKIVFRLQFHATQVPHPGWERLFVSLVPIEVGKPVAKTQRASVRDGVCKWSDPIYETTKLLQNPKTKKFDEKQYKLLVSTASSRNGLLGEVTINIADFAEVPEPSAVSLPLERCSFGTTLHVMIEPLTGKKGFREFEQQREVSDSGPGIPVTADDGTVDITSTSDHKFEDLLCGKSTSSEGSDASKQLTNGQAAKSASTNEKKQGVLVSKEVDKNASSGHSRSTTKHSTKQEISNNHENAIKKSSPSLTKTSKPPESSATVDQVVELQMPAKQTSGDWTQESSSDHSTENGAVNVYEENKTLKANLQSAEQSIGKLQAELAQLKREAEKQSDSVKHFEHVEKENSRDEFGKKAFSFSQGDVNDYSLKCKDAVSEELEKPDSGKYLKAPIQKFDSPKHAVKNFDLKSDKTQKAYADLLLSIQRSSSENIPTFTEELSADVFDLPALEHRSQTPAASDLKIAEYKDVTADLQIGHDGSIVTDKGYKSSSSRNPQLLESRAIYLEEQNNHLQERIAQLEEQLREYNRNVPSYMTNIDQQSDRDYHVLYRIGMNGQGNYQETHSSLKPFREKTKIDYETVISDLKEEISVLKESKGQIKQELQSLRSEHTGCLGTISALEGQANKLQKELNDQIMKLSLCKEDMAQLKQKLEQKANKAEMALKKTQIHNARIVQNLQRELERLALQVNSSFETNEKLMKQAFSESSDLRQQRNDLEIRLTTVREALEKSNAEISLIRRQHEERVQDLILRLNTSKKNEEELLSKLQSTANEIESLVNGKPEYISRNNELSQKLMLLENKIEVLNIEKSHLLGDLENSKILEAGFENHKRVVDECKLEKMRLEASLQRVTEEKNDLEREYGLLKKHLANSDEAVTKLQLSKVELENMIASLQFKLTEQDTTISASHEHAKELMDIQNHCSHLDQRLLEKERKIEDMQCMLDMHKEFQQKAEEEVFLLQSAKEASEEQLSGLVTSLQNARNEIEFWKRDGEDKVKDLMEQLELSRRQQEELKSTLDNTWSEHDKLKESETANLERIQELSQEVSALEFTMQDILKDKQNLMEKLEEFDIFKTDLENANASWDSAKVENTLLEASLQKLHQEKSALEHDVSCIRLEKEHSNRELCHFKTLTSDLEAMVSSLESKLNGNETQLSFYSNQEYELLQLKKQHSELQNSVLHEQTESKKLKTDLEVSKDLIQQSEMKNSELHSRSRDLEHKLESTMRSLEKSNEEVLFLKETLEGKLEELEISNILKNNALSKLDNMVNELQMQAKWKTECLSLQDRLQEFEALKSEFQSIRRKLDCCMSEKLELEGSLKRAEMQVSEIERENGSLKEMLEGLNSEIEIVNSYKQELEVNLGYLQVTMDERNNEYEQLFSEYISLKEVFLEEKVKTEELSEHLKHFIELREKAEVEANELRVQMKALEQEKTIAHESLRIALLREQYDTKERELTSKLEHSRKQSEELLLKLQDTLKELESRKKNEAQLVKKTEDLSQRLESDLVSLSKENESLLAKVKELEGLKLECEACRGNLEICKAEKAHSENLLLKANLEIEQLNNELISLKEMMGYSDKELDDLKLQNERLEIQVASLQPKLESQASQISILNDEITNGKMKNNELENTLSKQELQNYEFKEHNLHLEEELQERINEIILLEKKLNEKSSELAEISLSSLHKEKEYSDLRERLKLLEVGLKSNAGNSSEKEFHIKEIGRVFANVEDNVKYIKPESLDSCMDQLQRELEKMKTENLAPFQQESDHDYAPRLEDPMQKEVQQLEMVNEQLVNMFPSFNEPAKGGNAIERVLALERELAEALKGNSLNKRQFQSSFVKQLADQAAMLQSFRDINELINDMLDIKRKNSMLEDELKELQNRYSQMSLKFAEVEEERQKLIMSLKSNRYAKK